MFLISHLMLTQLAGWISREFSLLSLWGPLKSPILQFLAHPLPRIPCNFFLPASLVLVRSFKLPSSVYTGLYIRSPEYGGIWEAIFKQKNFHISAVNPSALYWISWENFATINHWNQGTGFHVAGKVPKSLLQH